MSYYEVYCDASFNINDKTGSYGIIITNRKTQEVEKKNGILKNIVNCNQAELIAIIKSIRNIEKDSSIIVYSDSLQIYKRYYHFGTINRKNPDFEKTWDTFISIINNKNQSVDIIWKSRKDRRIKEADRLARRALREIS